MVCIYCGHKKTNVVNSRPHRSAASVWRRRHCPNCQQTLTTYETIASQHLPLVNYPDNRSPQRFSTFRLAQSFAQILGTDDEGVVYELSLTVVQKIISSGHHEIELAQLTQYSYRTLVSYDRVAGTQYGIKHGVIDLPEH